MFFTAMMFFSSNALKYVSMSNQECKVRSAITNINSNEPLFYSNNILVNKCSGNCNNTNDPYTTLCVPGAIKDINVKGFNLVSKINKARYAF